MKSNRIILILTAVCCITASFYGTSTIKAKNIQDGKKSVAVVKQSVDIKSDKSKLIDLIANGSNRVIGKGVGFDGDEIGNKTGKIRYDWESGGRDHTHQFIVANAIDCIENDKGDSAAGDLINYSDTILEYADMPDIDEKGFPPFAGHFYNPYTGENYIGGTSDTALTEFIKHANNAVNNFSKDKTYAMQELGRACHYLGDMNEPHHAANLVAGLSTHSQYEKWADSHRCNYEVKSSRYYSSWQRGGFDDDCTHNAVWDAEQAYSHKDDVNSFIDMSKWDSATKACLDDAQEDTAGFLYRFLVEVGEENN